MIKVFDRENSSLNPALLIIIQGILFYLLNPLAKGMGFFLFELVLLIPLVWQYRKKIQPFTAFQCVLAGILSLLVTLRADASVQTFSVFFVLALNWLLFFRLTTEQNPTPQDLLRFLPRWWQQIKFHAEELR